MLRTDTVRNVCEDAWVMLGASRTPGSVDSSPGLSREGSVQCGGCARAFELRDWLALPLLGTLTGDAITAHVVRWPHGKRIEVRRCGCCGRPIARTGL